MKAFLVCPITKYIGRSGEKDIDRSYRAFVEGIYDLIHSHFGDVFLALREEAWGKRVLPSAICTIRDFKALRAADLVVAWPEDSCGSFIELGWASALGKPIIVILDGAITQTPLVLGLHALPGSGRVDELRLTPGSFENKLVALSGLLPSLLAEHVRALVGTPEVVTVEAVR